MQGGRLEESGLDIRVWKRQGIWLSPSSWHIPSQMFNWIKKNKWINALAQQMFEQTAEDQHVENRHPYYLWWVEEIDFFCKMIC